MNDKQKKWLIAGIIGAFAAVICCAGGIAGVVLWQTKWSDNGPRSAVSDFLDAAKHKDRSAMRSASCSSMPFEAIAFAVNQLEIDDYDLTSVDKHDKSASVDAKITYRVLGVADSQTFVFTVVDEDGWKVCGMRSQSR